MPVRVAELEAIFTGDLSNFTKAADAVEKRVEDIDGEQAAVDVLADASAALSSIDGVRDELDGIDGDEAQVGLLADTTEALQALDDVRSELDEVAKTDAEAVVTADVSDAEKAVEGVSDALKDLDGQDVEVDVDVDASGAERGLGRAGDGLEDFRDESSSIARESATSFTGEFEDMADVVRDLAANAFVGFGPAGAAAGIAVALGLGVAITKMQEVAEEADAATEATGDLAQEIIAAGGDIEAVDLAGKMQEWATDLYKENNWLTFWADESQTNLDRVRELAEDTGTDVTEFLTALGTGDVDAAADVLAGYKDELAAIDEQLPGLKDSYDQWARMQSAGGVIADEATKSEAALYLELTNRRDALDEIAGKMETHVDDLRDAEDWATQLGAAAAGLTEEQYELVTAVDAANAALDEQSGANRDVAAANLALKDQIAETSETIADSESKTRDKKSALLDLADQIVTTAEAEYNASGVMSDYNRVIEDNRAAFLEAADAAGIDEEAAEDLADAYGLIPRDVDTDIDADTSKARGKGESLTDWLNRLNAEVDVDADTSSAQTAIDGLISRNGGRSLTLGTRVITPMADGGISGPPGGAMIAAGGANLVHWAESETGGEAYIPLSPAKRGRSMAILDEVAARFGATLVKRADGAIDNAPAATAAVSGMPVYLSDAQIERLAVAMERGSARTYALATAGQDAGSRYTRGY